MTLYGNHGPWIMNYLMVFTIMCYLLWRRTNALFLYWLDSSVATIASYDKKTLFTVRLRHSIIMHNFIHRLMLTLVLVSHMTAASIEVQLPLSSMLSYRSPIRWCHFVSFLFDGHAISLQSGGVCMLVSICPFDIFLDTLVFGLGTSAKGPLCSVDCVQIFMLI